LIHGGHGKALIPSLPRQWPDGFWRFGLSSWAGSMLGTIAFSRTEIVALDAVHMATAAGIFAVAFGLSQQLTAPLDALSSVALGAISASSAVSNQRASSAVAKIMRAFSLALGPMLACTPGIAIAAPWVFGTEYQQISAVFLVFTTISALQSLAHPLQSYALSIKAGRALIMSNGAALVVDIALVVALVPHYGLWGAVVANVSAQLAALGSLWWTCRRRLALRPRQTWRAVAPTGIGAGILLAVWITKGPLLAAILSPAWEALVMIFLGMCAWMIAMKSLRLLPSRAEARWVWHRLPIGARSRICPLIHR